MPREASAVARVRWVRRMKCPDCGQYSLTYDWERNGWWCHVYNGFIPDEHMGLPSPGAHLYALLGKMYQKLCEIGAFG